MKLIVPELSVPAVPELSVPAEVVGLQAVKKDWKQMTCPSFEMFHWKRLVVDEFTYLDRKDTEIVRLVQSKYRWVPL